MLTAARWCRHAGNTRQTQRLCRAEVVFRTPFCLQTYRSVVVVGVAIVWEPSSDARGRVRPVNFPPSSSGAVRRLAVAVVAVVAVVLSVALMETVHVAAAPAPMQSHTGVRTLVTAMNNLHRCPQRQSTTGSRCT